MKNRKKDKKSSSYQSRIFLLLFMMSVMPILAAGGISYHVYLEEVMKQTDLSMQVIATQIYNDVEVTLSSMKQYYIDAAVGKEIQWLKNTDTVPYGNYTDVYKAQNILEGPTYLDAYIGNYAFINVGSRWILTNNGMYSFDELKNPGQTERFLENIFNHPSTLFWYNNISGSPPLHNGVTRSNTLDVSGYLLVAKLSSEVQNQEQVIVIQLNHDRLKQRLGQNLKDYQLCVLGTDGQILISSDQELAEYCRLAVDGMEPEPAPWNAQTGAGEYRLQAKGGSSHGLVYVLAYDVRTMKAGAGKVFQVFLIAGAILAVLLFFSRMISVILYRPVKNLSKYVLEISGEETIHKDEFSGIKKHVEHLYDKKESLQQLVRQQQNMLLEQFLFRVIRGIVTPEAIARFQEQFKIPGKRVYRLLAFVCTIDSENEEDRELENEALSMTVIKRLPEELLKELAFPPIQIGGQVLAVIGAESEERLISKTLAIHARLVTFMETEFSCSFIAGLSQRFTGLKYLKVAYNECAEALRNVRADAREKPALTFYDNIAENDAMIDGYDFVIENLMIKAVNQGDFDAAEELVDKFINSLHNRNIKGLDRSFFLYRMIIAVMSVLSDAGLMVNQVFTVGSEDMFQQINYIVDDDILKNYMNSQIIRPAMKALHDYRFHVSSDTLQKIAGLVHNSHGDITLTECAAQLNYHTSYIWKVLRSEWNMTFTDLVNREKLNAAKQLLRKTDLTVAEIAEQLSYSNAQNFIRFFSKYEKTTPGKYRRDHQEE